MSAAAASPTSRGILVDGHVHYHDGFDPTRFFDGARAHFDAAARELGLPAQTPGCLMFTESAWDHAFRAFRDASAAHLPAGWTLEAAEEAHSLFARREDGGLLLLVAGRQVVTREGLEILALGTDREFEDGLATRRALDAVRESGAIAVLPWGFGKWWLGRGALVREIVGEARSPELFLGDNAGRPRLAPRPALFRRAAARGIGVLPGSDPLPFASETGTAGCYGFRVAGELDPERPARSLDAAIRTHKGPFAGFGRRTGIARFGRHQVAMQWVKRSRAR